MLASVDSKPFTGTLNSLDATLTKKPGGGDIKMINTSFAARDAVTHSRAASYSLLHEI